MTGNLDDARRAYVGDLDTYVASGNYRDVYREGNVIYKVENHEGEGQNRLEYNRMASHRANLPIPFRFPNASLWEVTDFATVLACDFITGEEVGACGFCISGMPCDDEDVCVYEFIPDGFEDVWSDSCIGNAIRNETGIYIVDFVW